MENRQLLSVFPGSSSSAADLSQPVIQPNVAVAPVSPASAPSGLSPSKITTAYGVNQITFNGGVTGNGKGQTIAIVDAYYDPKIASDLLKFDTYYGLSAPASFTQYVTPGLKGDNAGWALETSLDVEWAHAIAPAASILLVEAPADLNSLLSAVTYATEQPGVSVVSMSWGSSEFSGEASNDGVFTTPANHIGGSGLAGGITFVASSGDSGSSGAPEYPSVSPNVLAVGGTTLKLNGNGTYSSESGWSGSGGGYSAFESEPSYQTAAINASGLNSGARTTPDVSWDANPATGVSVYDSVRYGGQSGWFTVGGTSVGAPSWAGLIAIADQGLALKGVGSLANAQSSLYQLPASDFHDITTGSNGGYSAGKGYDLVTGIGTPIANQVVPGLVSINTPAHSVPVSFSGVATAPHATIGQFVLILTAATTDSSSAGGTDLSTSTVTTLSKISITPLSSNTTSTAAARTITPVLIVPPPLPPLVTHLSSSAVPVTAQSTTTLSLADELPTAITRLGQGFESERPTGPVQERRDSRKSEPSWIDIVEPAQPAAPVDAPKNAPAPAPAPALPLPPAAWRNQPLPVLSAAAVDAVLELFEIGELTGSIDRSPARAENQADHESSTWKFSTLFGAAVIATGGYRLAIRGSKPINRYWLPDPISDRRSPH